MEEQVVNSAVTVIDTALHSGVIVGVTEVIKKWIPQVARDYIMPLVAMIVGIGVSVYPAIESGSAITGEMVFTGIVLGGTVTGLYAVTRSAGKKDGFSDVQD